MMTEQEFKNFVFGTGKVVEVTNTLVSVAFKHPHGIKKLMKNHKKLSKV